MYEIIEGSKVIFTGTAEECGEFLGYCAGYINAKSHSKTAIKLKYFIRQIGRKQRPFKKYKVYYYGEVIDSGLTVPEIAEKYNMLTHNIYARSKEPFSMRGFWFEAIHND